MKFDAYAALFEIRAEELARALAAYDLRSVVILDAVRAERRREAKKGRDA
ncbi:MULTISPECIES: hypothetical protein [unclassified Paracoccus (in: a-proteobacteria)]|nr:MULTISPECIES: hypothetical protein [unclassified Paracoccus (in: a-proteobacteria)]SMG55849.1 hypothetical protein SAMN02746000_03761 [Paracoccus sp. J56]